MDIDFTSLLMIVGVNISTAVDFLTVLLVSHIGWIINHGHVLIETGLLRISIWRVVLPIT